MHFTQVILARFLKCNWLSEEPTMATIKDSTTARQGTKGLQKVAVINGSSEVLELLEVVLDAGHYDVIFMDSNEHAYSQVRRLQPQMVVLCMQIEDVEAFHVLSMLKMDDDTKRIPVLTYTTEYEGQDVDGRLARLTEDDLLSTRHALRMN